MHEDALTMHEARIPRTVLDFMYLYNSPRMTMRFEDPLRRLGAIFVLIPIP